MTFDVPDLATKQVWGKNSLSPILQFLEIIISNTHYNSSTKHTEMINNRDIFHFLISLNYQIFNQLLTTSSYPFECKVILIS